MIAGVAFAGYQLPDRYVCSLECLYQNDSKIVILMAAAIVSPSMLVPSSARRLMLLEAGVSALLDSRRAYGLLIGTEQ